MTDDVTRTGPPPAADPDATRSATGRAADPPRPPSAVPGYALHREIGRGAMGVVYEATHLGLNRTVALKMLRPGDAADRVASARFLAEAQIVAAVRHPNVVEVYDFGEQNGVAYLAMELFDGGTLAERLKPNTSDETVTAPGPNGSPALLKSAPGLKIRLEPREAATLLEQLATAVGAFHEQGIVHRDLKPGNVLFNAAGVPKVADFGLAKRSTSELTATQAVMGTPAYMSPEQAGGQAKFVGPPTDVWALGVMLYECLSGRRPFESEGMANLLLKIQREEPPTLRAAADRVPHDLETICAKCLEKEPERRYATAAELADDLRRYRNGQPILARPVGSVERLTKWVRRNRSLAAALSGVFLVLLLGVAFSSWFAWVANQKAAEADLAAKQAATDRDAARDAAAESRRRMVRLNILTGTRSLDAGDSAAAMLWFHQAWDLDRGEPAAEPSHRARLAGLLETLPDLVGGGFHAAAVLDASFSPDGTRVLTRPAEPEPPNKPRSPVRLLGRELHVWDYEKFRLARPPLVHAGKVIHACWNPDGSRIAAATDAGEVAVWDAATGTRGHTFRHAKAVTWVEFHPTLPRLLSASEDGTVRLWDLSAGGPVAWSLSVPSVVDHAAFSADGTRVITAGRDDTVRVWSVDSSKQISPPLPYKASTFTQRHQFHYDRWPRLRADGRAAVSFRGENLSVWNDGAGEVKTYPMAYGIAEVYWLPNTNHVLATGDKYNRVAVVRADTGQDVYVLRHPRQANVANVGADGKLLVTASSGGTIHLWDAATGRPVWKPQPCADFASAVQISRDGTRCLAASQDGTLRVWAVASRKLEVKPYRPDGRGNYVSVKQDSGDERAFSADGKTWIDFGANRPAQFSGRPIPSQEAITGARFCNAGNRFLTSGATGVQLWDADRLAPLGPVVRVPFAKNADYLHDRLSNDGSTLAAWDDEKTISVWNLTTGRRVFGPFANADPGEHIFGPDREDGFVNSLAMSADGKRLAAATDSAGTLTVWDVGTGQRLHRTRRYRGYSQGFGFSADGTRVLLWASDNIARVYDAETGEPVGPGVRPALSKAQYVRVNANECAISADGRRLAFYESGLATVRVWDADRADSLFAVSFPNPNTVARMWFAPDGATVNLVADGQALSIPVPRFDVPTELTRPLVRFLTGQQIDATDGLEFIDQFTFLNDPESYHKAVRAWKKIGDDGVK